MKKFGRQAQYYRDSKSIENINNNINDNILYEAQQWNNDIDYDDPVDLEFFNQFQHLPNSDLNSSKKSSNKKNKDKYSSSKFYTPNSNNNSNQNNNSSTYVKYFKLSELNDNNPYNCLDVSQLATEEEIRKAYKKLILINHPDKGGDSDQFNKIHEAYQMLSNPVTKKIIDTFGSMSLDLVKNIITNDLINSKQLIEDVNFCIQQNDYPQLYFLLNNNIKN